MASLIVIDNLGVDSESHIHVPFKDGGNTTAAVMSSNADFIFHNWSDLTGDIESGQLRALVVTTPERVSRIPDTPTATEVGHPNLNAVVGWFGVWGPGDMATDAVNAATSGLGSIPTVMSLEDTRVFVEQQFDTFRAFADRLGMVVR